MNSSRSRAASRALAIVDYVYGRSIVESNQEVGGVTITLAAFCLAIALELYDASETELTRVWMKVEQIHTKQAAEPKHSLLLGPASAEGT